jgi:hypothetical protein
MQVTYYFSIKTQIGIYTAQAINVILNKMQDANHARVISQWLLHWTFHYASIKWIKNFRIVFARSI